MTAMVAMPFLFGGMFFYSVLQLHKAHLAEAWPTARGKVTVSNWTYRGGKGCNYILHFNYRYTVADSPYSGDNYIFGGTCYYEEARKAVEENPVGSEVIVHYSPENAAESVIAAGQISSNTRLGIWTMGFFLMLSFGMLVLVFLGMRMMKKMSPAEAAYVKQKLEHINDTTPRNYVLEKLEEQARQDIDGKS